MSDGKEHRTHCCLAHGCKYGEFDTCPVVNKKIEQLFPCEQCREWQENLAKKPGAIVCVSCRQSVEQINGWELCPRCNLHQARVVDAIVKHCESRGMFETAKSIRDGHWGEQAYWLQEEEDDRGGAGPQR